MTMKGPVLVEARDLPQSGSAPALDAAGKTPRRWGREATLACVSTLIGGVLGIGGSLLQENLRIANHAPTLSISAVQAFTPELTVPNKDIPTPPSKVERQLEVLTKRLGLTDDNMSIPSDDAQGLIKSAVKTRSLDDMDSPLKFLRINTWVANMRTAAHAVIGYYTAETLFERLLALLSNSSLSRSQTRDEFIKLLDENPENANSLALIHLPYTLERTQGSAPAEEQDEKAGKIGARPKLFDVYQVPDGPIFDYGLAVGKFGIMLPSEHNIPRSFANRNVATVISRFDRTEFANLVRITSDDLLHEISDLQAFLNESNKLIQQKVKPRVSVEMTAFNSSRAPITIAPYSALRITGKNDVVYDLALRLEGTDKDTGDAVAVTNEDDQATKFATVDSGHFVKSTWVGEFEDGPAKWDTLVSSYNKGPLSCELTLETLGSLKARSASAPFGGPSQESLKVAQELATATLP